MPKYDTYEEACLNIEHIQYSDKPGVTVAYHGTKKINGQETDIPCIIVGVETKIPKEQLNESELIPSKVYGIPTDIIEFPRFYSSSTCTGGSGAGCSPHDERHRPLVGGISAVEETSTACTLGLIVRDTTDGDLVALTNNHCGGLLYDSYYMVPTYGNSSVVGLGMMQPSPYDGGGAADLYGSVKRAVAMQFGTGIGATNLVDCSISTVPIDGTDFSILELNEGPFPFVDKSYYSVGEAIYKSGRTTGNTPPPVTTVSSKSIVVNVDYGGGVGGINNIATFTDQILYTAATRFSQGGDSGSAILIFKNGRYRLIGLHFAGDATGTMGIANPIEDVASLLDIEWWDGSVVVPYTEDTNIYVNGKEYVRVGSTSYDVSHTAGSSSSSSESGSSSSS